MSQLAPEQGGVSGFVLSAVCVFAFLYFSSFTILLRTMVKGGLAALVVLSLSHTLSRGLPEEGRSVDRSDPKFASERCARRVGRSQVVYQYYRAQGVCTFVWLA